jgi:hypothetical protein
MTRMLPTETTCRDVAPRSEEQGGGFAATVFQSDVRSAVESVGGTDL